MHEKQYRHPNLIKHHRDGGLFEKTTETTSMAVGAVGLGLEKRDGKSKIYVKNIEKRSNSQNDGCNWKKHRENWLLSFCDSIFSYKNLGAPFRTSADFLQPWALHEAATMMMCQICQVSRIFPHPKNKLQQFTQVPSVGFCPPNLWVPMVGVLWSKKKISNFLWMA